MPLLKGTILLVITEKLGWDVYKRQVDSLTKLYKLKLEEDKNAIEHMEKIENRESDKDFKYCLLYTSRCV